MPRLFVLWLIFCFACPASAADAAPTIVRDVTYRTVEGQDLKLDVAVPAGAGPFPAIVVVHGGGWVSGHRSRIWIDLDYAARRGFVAATVTYRLAKGGEATGDGQTPSVDGFPAALQDVKAAVRFLRANAADYKIDPERVGITGESAGGHLSLLVGLTRPEDGLDGPLPPDAPSSAVQAVVNVFGPTDLARLSEDMPGDRPMLVVFLGGLPEAKPAVYKAASPIAYVRGDAPPILTLQGTHDPLVPLSQAQLLDAALEKAGAPHGLIVFAGAGHGFWGRDRERGQRALFDFFDRTLKPKTEPPPI